MDKGVKIYHVETQKDYDDLMIELEKQGYTWFSGKKPTHINTWTGEETIIYSNDREDYTITYGFISTAREKYPNRDIIKHKAKGVEQMEKVVVPQCVADWYKECEAESLYSTLSYFLNGIKSTEELEKWAETCEGESAYPKVNAEKKIAKMHLYGYEVEKEKKYYWRKKKEHVFDFENERYRYINIDKKTGLVFLDAKTETRVAKTLITESELKQRISEEDFNKLEKVEITE